MKDVSSPHEPPHANETNQSNQLNRVPKTQTNQFSEKCSTNSWSSSGARVTFLYKIVLPIFEKSSYVHLFVWIRICKQAKSATLLFSRLTFLFGWICPVLIHVWNGYIWFEMSRHRAIKTARNHDGECDQIVDRLLLTVEALPLPHLIIKLVSNQVVLWFLTSSDVRSTDFDDYDEYGRSADEDHLGGASPATGFVFLKTS